MILGFATQEPCMHLIGLLCDRVDRVQLIVEGPFTNPWRLLLSTHHL